jgi:hypothetical protein
MSEETYSLLGLLAAIILVVGLFIVIVADQRDELKAEAVKRGFAEWIVTGQNQTEFKWRDKQ